MKAVLCWLDKHFEETLMSVFLCGVVIMMTIHVFCRYVLQAPLTWSEEATRYMFIWFVFTGVSYGIRNGTHIRVNILEVFFPKVIPVFSLIQDVVGAAFVLYLIPAAISSILRRTAPAHGVCVRSSFGGTFLKRDKDHSMFLFPHCQSDWHG